MENTNILAAVSASGSTLPALTFQSEQGQATWRSFSDPTSEHFPLIQAKESGWMKADVFYKQLREWEARTTRNNECELETCLMICDGHLMLTMQELNLLEKPGLLY